jgi:branched-chain amino acid transport system substrate-binding protein
MVNGDTSDYEKWLNAIYSVELKDSPRGPMKVDKYGQIVENIYISEVRKINGEFHNVIVETYPMVSQYWKYDPEEYLKQPVYSRDNPPCRNCE